jgi:hypothetical protein
MQQYIITLVESGLNQSEFNIKSHFQRVLQQIRLEPIG